MLAVVAVYDVATILMEAFSMGSPLTLSVTVPDRLAKDGCRETSWVVTPPGVMSTSAAYAVSYSAMLTSRVLPLRESGRSSNR